MRLFTSLAILFITLPALAQKPGYLGKIFFLDTDIGASVTLTDVVSFLATDDPTTENKYGNPKTSSTPALKLSANMVVGRRSTLGVGLNMKTYTHTRDPLTRFQDDPEITFRTKSRFIDFTFYHSLVKKGRHALAPLGSYAGYKLFFGKIQTYPLEFTNSGKPLTDAQLDIFNQVYKLPRSINFVGFGFVLGKRYMLTDAVSFHYQFEIAAGGENNDTSGLVPSFGNKSYALSGSLHEQKLLLVCTFNLGVGVFLF